MIQQRDYSRVKYDGEKFKIEREEKLKEITALESETVKMANEYAMAVRLGQTEDLFYLNSVVEKLSSQLSIIHL